MLELPNLIKFSGDWKKYEAELYAVFKKDFLESRLRLKSLPVGIRKEPKEKGKEATFWHITTFGKKEKERLQDLRKCERICWIKPIIESFPHKDIKVWLNRRGRDERICLCYGNCEYLVVLRKMPKYVLLITAYPVKNPQTKTQLQNQRQYYLRSKKTNTAL